MHNKYIKNKIHFYENKFADENIINSNINS